MRRKTVTFAEAADSYVRQGGEFRYLPRVLERLGDRMVDDIVPGEVRLMAIDLYPDGLNQTRNRHVITPTKAVMAHAHQMGWCHAVRIPNLRRQPTVRKVPPDQVWLSAFIEQCERDGLRRLAALVLFMNHTGARISETLRLCGEDVDLEAGTATLLRTKTARGSVRTLSAELRRRIRAIGLRDGDRVFGQRCRHNVNDRICCVSLRAGIEPKTAHYVGRGAFATNALLMGLDIRTAMDAGGWKTARMFLEVYAHSAAAGRKMADRIDLHYPRRQRDWLLQASTD